MGCRTPKNKTDLIRIVRTPEGQVKVDSTGKANGRGAYLCRDPECLKKALKQKALQRALKCEVPDEISESLIKEISNGE